MNKTTLEDVMKWADHYAFLCASQNVSPKDRGKARLNLEDSVRAYVATEHIQAFSDGIVEGRATP